MISKKQYKDSDKVVKDYIKQEKGTPILWWDKRFKCSARLRRVLEELQDSTSFTIYIESINKDTLFLVKGSGAHCWNEFKELRGY